MVVAVCCCLLFCPVRSVPYIALAGALTWALGDSILLLLKRWFSLPLDYPTMEAMVHIKSLGIGSNGSIPQNGTVASLVRTRTVGARAILLARTCVSDLRNWGYHQALSIQIVPKPAYPYPAPPPAPAPAPAPKAVPAPKHVTVCYLHVWWRGV